ncbi:hypothetical protein BO70DRAFT_362355 [Aspergillus heteromorphus CBS 117.55]|uniref:DUF3824 domain-containing protein n=1 Tax=Aspergillus heteromorphus CBS 117.55 TaxID=1448321 RepID=A0A317W780_9EURO|nr:uncharacterized protein BO70DRAFT_362355 [Aspergillus heteromorphus CBS 117.55]PWY81929.1 hypothetical protein BO70DRAFT_362355 [Aspergillus heteromorphus CBS 117.55]
MTYHDNRRPADYNSDYYYAAGPPPTGRTRTDVVRHSNPSVESFESVPRDYPPGEYGYEYGYGYPPQARPSRVATVPDGLHRSHSMGYRDESDYYRRSHHRSRRQDDRRDRHRYSRSPSESRSPPRRRRKSFSEQALGALGLGSVASSGSRHRERDRGRSHGRDRRSYSYSPSPTRDRSRHRRDKSEQRIAQAVRAALTAGAVEAFRVRKDPGEWTGEKGKRILTAAITAGGTDGLVDRNPDKHSKRHIIESTLAGLAANHFINGSRSRSRSRGRGRSDSQGGLKNLVATGAIAAAGKEAYDRFRSKSRPRSRSRGRGRSSSRDSYEDRRPRHRSKSVSDYINQGMEALGLGSKEKHGRRDQDRRDQDRRDYDRRDHGGRSSRRDDYSDDSDYESRRYGSPRRSRHSRDVSRPLSAANTPARPSTRTTSQGNGAGRGRVPPHGEHSNSDQDTDSDLGSSTDEEDRQKKLTRKMLVKSGLAAVATIHAAHNIHESMEKHKKRAEQVREGEITAEEARHRRIKGQLGDVASVGLAALGIKGAVGEWKHVKEAQRERMEFAKGCDERRERRHQRARSHGPISRASRTVYPDEIEEHHPSEYGSTADLRSRSAGRTSRVPVSQYA